jgi:hypothetical protein
MRKGWTRTAQRAMAAWAIGAALIFFLVAFGKAESNPRHGASVVDATPASAW